MADEILERIKETVDKKCAELDNQLLVFTPGMQGKDIRDRILQLVGFMGRYNELYVKARLRADSQETRLDYVRAIATKKVSEHPEYKAFSVPTKQQIVEIEEVEIAGEKTTCNREAEILNYYTYAMNRYKSRFDDVENTIRACQSVLSFDREEMKNLGANL